MGPFLFWRVFSPGGLKIEGHCQIVSARKIIDRDLYNIRSEFQQYANWSIREARWAYAVIEIREIFAAIRYQRYKAAGPLCEGSPWITVSVNSRVGMLLIHSILECIYTDIYIGLLKEPEGHLRRSSKLTEAISLTEEGSISVDDFAAAKNNCKELAP